MQKYSTVHDGLVKFFNTHATSIGVTTIFDGPIHSKDVPVEHMPLLAIVAGDVQYDYVSLTPITYARATFGLVYITNSNDKTTAMLAARDAFGVIRDLIMRIENHTLGGLVNDMIMDELGFPSYWNRDGTFTVMCAGTICVHYKEVNS